MANYERQSYGEPRKKTALDNRKLALSAPSGSTGKYASLVFTLNSNSPWFTVYTNDPEDQTEKNNNGKIQAKMDVTTFGAVIELLKKVIDEPAPYRDYVINDNFNFYGGKKSDKPMPQSEIHIGKDEDGSIWIAVFHFNKERPRIKFYFGASFDSYNKVVYHQFFHANKEPYTRAETSVLYAKSYIRLLSGLYTHLLVTEYVEPAPKENGGGGRGNGGGGGNRGERSGGGGSADQTASGPISDSDFMDF